MHRPFRTLLSVTTGFVLASVSMSTASAAKPVGWRGDGSGVFSGGRPPVGWSETSNIVWKAKMPGRSNSQPAIVAGRLFVCSEPSDLICLDLKTGKVLWKRSHAFGDFVAPKQWAKAEAELKLAGVIHARIAGLKKDHRALERQADSGRGDTKAIVKKLTAVEKQIETETEKLKKYPLAAKYISLGTHQRMNGYTTATPTTDGKHVWAVFGNAVVACYDLAGKRRWVRKMKDLPHSMFGHSSSPLLIGKKLVVNIEDTVALDAATGKEVWRTGFGQMWGSSIHIRIGGVDHVALANGKVLRLSDGKIVTRAPFVLSDASAIVNDGIVYYVQNRGGAVRLPEETSDKFKLAPLWKTNPRGQRYFASPVLLDGLLYTVSSQSIVAVIDAKDGKVLYQKRLGIGRGTAYPSVVAAGGHVYVSNDNGTTVVLKPGRAYKEVARNRIEGFISTPVVHGDRIYVRTYGHVYCIGRKTE